MNMPLLPNSVAEKQRYENGRESKVNALSCERKDQFGGSPCDPGNNREVQDVSIAPKPVLLAALDLNDCRTTLVDIGLYFASNK